MVPALKQRRILFAAQSTRTGLATSLKRKPNEWYQEALLMAWMPPPDDTTKENPADPHRRRLNHHRDEKNSAGGGLCKHPVKADFGEGVAV